MVYPKNKLKARKAILEALKEHNTPETGIGYNMLFDKVKNKIKSRSTFNKYLDELKAEEYLAKADDERHKMGVVIYRKPSSKYELQTIELIEQLKKIFNQEDLRNIAPQEPFINENIEMVYNCIFWAHKTLTEMVPEIKRKFGKSPYIRTNETDDGWVNINYIISD